MFEDENDLFDWVPDMDLDGDHDLYDEMLLEEDEAEEKKNSGFFDDDEDDVPNMDDSDWEEDEFENDEFDFSVSSPSPKRGKAKVVWADPVSAPAEAANANGSAAQSGKVGLFSTVCFGIGLFLLGVLACYILLTVFSAFFLESGRNTDLSKTVLIFSLIFSAIFVGWLSIPVSKKKDEWAFKAVNTVALTLVGVALVFFIVFCRLD